MKSSPAAGLPSHRAIVALDIEQSTSPPIRSRPSSAARSTSCSTRHCARRESASATVTGSPTAATASSRSSTLWTRYPKRSC